MGRTVQILIAMVIVGCTPDAGEPKLCANPDALVGPAPARDVTLVLDCEIEWDAADQDRDPECFQRFEIVHADGSVMRGGALEIMLDRVDRDFSAYVRATNNPFESGLVPAAMLHIPLEQMKPNNTAVLGGCKACAQLYLYAVSPDTTERVVDLGVRAAGGIRIVEASSQSARIELENHEFTDPTQEGVAVCSDGLIHYLQ